MGKIALVFAGRGEQDPRLGRELGETVEDAASLTAVRKEVQA